MMQLQKERAQSRKQEEGRGGRRKCSPAVEASHVSAEAQHDGALALAAPAEDVARHGVEENLPPTMTVTRAFRVSPNSRASRPRVSIVFLGVSRSISVSDDEDPRTACARVRALEIIV